MEGPPCIVLYRPPRLLFPNDVTATVARAFQRKPYPPLDAAIETIWAEKKAEKGDHLYNDWKFRLHNCSGDGEGKLTLQLGITDYKTNLGVSLLRYAEYQAALPPEELNQHLPQVLGVEIVCLTCDGKLTLFKRAQHTSEFPGMYCFPGGHAEPKSVFNAGKLEAWRELQTRAGSDASDGLDSLADFFEFVASTTISRELFLSASMEVAEELGVPEESVTVGLCGVIETHVNGKPDLCFLCRLPQSSAEIQRTFDSRQQISADESVENSLILPDAAKVLESPESVFRFVHHDMGGLITPCSISSLWLAQQLF